MYDDISRVMRKVKRVFGISDQVLHKPVLQQRNMARGMKFWI